MGNSTTLYYTGYFAAPYNGTALQTVAAANSNAFKFCWRLEASELHCNIELSNPFSAKPTNLTSGYAADNFGFGGGGFHNVSTSYTAFTVGSVGGETMTGGTIYVYGYGAN